MSKYNTRISRSRSSERYRDENNERFKYEEMKRNKEEEIDRKIERIKDDERKREREWEKEKQDFLKRENDLLWEIERMKKQKYNQYNEERGRFPRTNYERRGYQTFYPRQGQFSNFKSYTQNINNQRTANFNPTNKPSTSELNKLLTNIDKNKTNNNNTDLPKFRNKIYLPQIKGVNLVGLLIGPQGVFQKLLEEKTGCKIYINGKNVKRRGAYVLPQDNDRAHVLIIGYSQEKVRNATQHLEKIIFADEATRNQIIQEESKVFQQSGEKNETTSKSQDYLMTPHGPPGENARFYKVPNDLVGLIIGANGETIRKIAMESNCKVLAGLAPIPNTQLRYIFIEGNEENYQIAVRMIEKIIGDNANKK